MQEPSKLIEELMKIMYQGGSMKYVTHPRTGNQIPTPYKITTKQYGAFGPFNCDLEQAKAQVRRAVGNNERMPQGYDVVAEQNSQPQPPYIPQPKSPGVGFPPPHAKQETSQSVESQLETVEGEWGLIEKVVAHVTRMWIGGPPSGGKSHLARNYGLNGNGPCITVPPIHEEMDPSALIGMYTLKDSGTVWVDGPAVVAMKEGRRLVLDEVSRASLSLLDTLLYVMDDPFDAGGNPTLRLRLDNGEVVTPRKGFQVIATDNGRFEDLDPALRSRFEVAINTTTPHPGNVKALPEDLRNAALATFPAEANPHIGMRAWHNYARLRVAVGDETAAKAVFGDQANDALLSLKMAKEAANAA